jgi:hypothetical protein
VLGLILLGIANVGQLIVLRQLVGAITCLYVAVSVFEHIILESGNRKIAKQWSIFNLQDI